MVLSAKNDDPRKALTQAELDLLTDTWEIWVENATTQTRKLGRMRLHLFFLLFRFGGLRPTEIGEFKPDSLDTATGLLRIAGRRIFLPARALRSLRRILSLREAREPDFLSLNDGFLRRTFYAVAALARLPPALCAPRALRYARALELLGLRMTPDLVSRSLGFSNPCQLASLLSADMDPFCSQEANSCNRFSAILTAFDAGSNSARLFFQITARLKLHCICTLEEFLTVEPAIGQSTLLYVSPGSILPAKCEDAVNANHLKCRILSFTQDQFEIRINLAPDSHLKLTAAYDKRFMDVSHLKTGAQMGVYIPPHAIELCNSGLDRG